MCAFLTYPMLKVSSHGLISKQFCRHFNCKKSCRFYSLLVRKSAEKFSDFCSDFLQIRMFCYICRLRQDSRSRLLIKYLCIIPTSKKVLKANVFGHWSCPMSIYLANQVMGNCRRLYQQICQYGSSFDLKASLFRWHMRLGAPVYLLKSSLVVKTVIQIRYAQFQSFG